MPNYTNAHVPSLPLHEGETEIPRPEIELRADAALGLSPDAQNPVPLAGRTSQGRFAKGSSGNPAGRPPKKPARALSLGEEIKELLDQTRIIERGGRSMETTVRKLIAESALRKAIDKETPLSGVLKLMAYVEKHADKVEPMCGVLVVPGVMNKEDWEREAAANQSKYRVNCGSDSDDK